MQQTSHSFKPSDFQSLYNSIDNAFKKASKPVTTERWQGKSNDNRPEMMTHELLNVSFTIILPTEDPEYYRNHVKPNLPWADNHFLERVCGEPINPGVEWKNWPWGKHAEKSMYYVGGPRRSSADWAYLAGFIDGEGSISHATANTDEDKYARIKISQVNKDQIDYLYNLFNVGTVRQSSTTGNLSDNYSWVWRISKREEVRWILHNTLPYLRLKKDKVKEALDQLPEFDRRSSDHNFNPLGGMMYNHNYMERYWCAHFPGNVQRGIGNQPYGDMWDLVKLLADEPYTRQAWIPIFFPEDTGVGDGGRKPCTLGYQFLMREGDLHVYYPLRSCDYYRHFKDDIYLTIRLCLWVLEQCKNRRPDLWAEVYPGTLTMHCTSLHVFANDYRVMFK